MFICRYNGKLYLGNENGYYDEDISYKSVNWEPKGSFVSVPNFVASLSEFPVYERAKIICVGRNYAEHAKELGSEVPKEPLLFWKPHSSLLGPHGKILLPKMSKDIQHETELVAIIGKGGSHIPINEAMDHVLGFTVGLDITARDLQRSDSTWFRGKGFDTFAPVGPIVVPKDSVNLQNCSIKLEINGQQRQIGNTKDFIFDLPTVVSYASQIVTLEEGDIIFTGTPEGVGKIASGDRLEASIANIGTLEVTVA